MSETWKVYCVDTFDGTKWLEGEFATKDEADRRARLKSGTMLRAHVEAPKGHRVASYGTS